MKRKKVLKNEDSPGGRKDWEGRTPRRRVNLLNSQLRIIKEWAEEYFKKYPERRTDQVYNDLYERIDHHIQQIDKPLMKEIKNNDNTLF